MDYVCEGLVFLLVASVLRLLMSNNISVMILFHLIGIK